MITRTAYMRDSKALHQQYYFQFVTELTEKQILRSIGLEALLASTDHHLNDVVLPFNNMGSGGTWWWDTISVNVTLLRSLGEIDSHGTRTCVGKAMARHMIDKVRTS